MKKNILYVFLTFIALGFVSCSKDEIPSTKSFESERYSNANSQQRITLAKGLIAAFNENPELSKVTSRECNKLFDGDREVLLKSLFTQQVSNNGLRSSNNTFGSILDKYLHSLPIKRTSENASISEQITKSDSLLQLYLYVNSESTDSTSFNGIVVLPESYNEKRDTSLMLIKNDGTITSIRGDIDPSDNYLVLSDNERSNYNLSSLEHNQQSNLKSANSEPNYTVGKGMSITKASFISMDALRSVEGWTRGQPEVRLNLIYEVLNHTTNTFDVKTSTFRYPESWWRSNFWGNKFVKWNEALINCPYWYFYEQGFSRRIILTEEDGSYEEREITTEVTDPLTKIKTNIVTKRPASTEEQLIADSYIDYLNPGTGEISWGIIKLYLSF